MASVQQSEETSDPKVSDLADQKVSYLGDQNVGDLDEEHPSEVRRSERQRTLTEKGKEYVISQKTLAVNSLSSNLKKTCRELDVALSAERIDFVRSRDDLKFELERFEYVFDELRVLADGYLDSGFVEKIEKISAHAESVLQSINSELRELAKETRSKGSGRSLKVDQAKADVDKAEANMQHIETQEIQLQLKKLQLEKGMAAKQVANAREQLEIVSQDDSSSFGVASQIPSVHESLKNSGDVEISKSKVRGRAQMDDINSIDSIQKCRDYVLGHAVDPQQEAIRVLCDQLRLSRLPVPEPGVFTGDPLQFSSWKNAFCTLIACRSIPEVEQLHYLKRYLGGPARDSVEGFFLLNTSTAFQDAFKLLEARYGNSFVMGNAFRDKLENWPKISSRDYAALRKFSDFLQQCLSGMKTIPSLRFLDDDGETRKLLLKLPDWLIQRWRRIVVDFKDKSGVFPSFAEFAKFIAKESDIANDPVTLLPSYSKSQSDSKGDKRVTSHSVQSSKKTGDKKGTSSKMVVRCNFCKQQHANRYCSSLRSKSKAEKRDFAVKNKLCYRCLTPGHVVAKCKVKVKCDNCQSDHATIVHGVEFPRGRNKKVLASDVNQSNSNSSSEGILRPEVQSFYPRDQLRVSDRDVNYVQSQFSACSGATIDTAVGAGKMCSMIVPVYVSHSSAPGNERLVYALLDTQSDTSFILDSTCAAIGITGEPVELSLSTMFAENRKVSSNKVTGLMVRGFDSDLRLEIPLAYTRDIMPANRSHIPTQEMVQQWPYLAEVGSS